MTMIITEKIFLRYINTYKLKDVTSVNLKELRNICNILKNGKIFFVYT